jgi:hypothetical protein
VVVVPKELLKTDFVESLCRFLGYAKEQKRSGEEATAETVRAALNAVLAVLEAVGETEHQQASASTSALASEPASAPASASWMKEEVKKVKEEDTEKKRLLQQVYNSDGFEDLFVVMNDKECTVVDSTTYVLFVGVLYHMAVVGWRASQEDGNLMSGILEWAISAEEMAMHPAETARRCRVCLLYDIARFARRIRLERNGIVLGVLNGPLQVRICHILLFFILFFFLVLFIYLYLHSLYHNNTICICYLAAHKHSTEGHADGATGSCRVSGGAQPCGDVAAALGS